MSWNRGEIEVLARLCLPLIEDDQKTVLATSLSCRLFYRLLEPKLKLHLIAWCEAELVRLKKKSKKRPVTAYQVYMQEFIHGNRGTCEQKDLFKIAAASWRSLGDNERCLVEEKAKSLNWKESHFERIQEIERELVVIRDREIFDCFVGLS